MKKTFLAALATGAFLVGMAGVASATTINYSSIDSAANKTSPYSSLPNFQLETFDSSLLWTWTGNSSIVSGSSAGYYAAPYGVSQPDQTNYVTVPNPQAGPAGSVTVDLGGGLYDYFGLWWGSIDQYNTLSFFNGGSPVASYTGQDVLSPDVASGNQTAPSNNTYVNFLNLPKFDSFVMASTQFAFEADNIAVGVPEPASMLLMGTGLAGLMGIGARRKMRK